jgi:putative transposase
MSPPGTYFVTSVSWGRRSLFVAEPMARLFLQTLYGYRRQSKFRLHAFVLMPEHFHLLITPTEITLERAIQLIKGGYSHAVKHQLGKGLEIWERGFTDHRIHDFQDFERHCEYVHKNPVKRGLVANAREFRYCSAFPGFRLDPWPEAPAVMAG